MPGFLSETGALIAHGECPLFWRGGRLDTAEKVI